MNYVYDYIVVYRNKTNNRLSVSDVMSDWTKSEIDVRLARLREGIRENNLNASVRAQILRKRKIAKGRPNLK